MADVKDIIEIEEVDQANHLVATYVKSILEQDKARLDITIPESSNSYVRNILNAFLPAGYPHSVTDDYLEYQIYDSLQAFSSSIAGMLSSRAVLEGIGVGDSKASPTSALLLSVLQESMGRIATILFAHRLGTALEPECKMYRLAADVFNDAAMIFDCLSPAFPKGIRVGLLCASSVLRALCGVAAGSSKASLSAHFATQNNLGELNAKDSSQETVISLMGMLAGTVVVSCVSSKWATWTSLIFLLVIHLATNYLAVFSVCMRTLNRQRANLVFSAILFQLLLDRRSLTTSTDADGRQTTISSFDFRCPMPPDVRWREIVFEKDGVLRFNRKILGHCQVGVNLQTLQHSFGSDIKAVKDERLFRLLEIFKDENYIVSLDKRQMIYFIVLKEHATTTTILSAWLFALLHAKNQNPDRGKDFFEGLEWTRRVIGKIWPEVEEKLRRAGWDLDVGAIETTSGTRIRMKGRT